MRAINIYRVSTRVIRPRKQRGDGRTREAEARNRAQAEDEQRIEDQIRQGGDHHDERRGSGITGGPHDPIGHHGYDQEYGARVPDGHVVVEQRDERLLGAEQTEDRPLSGNADDRHHGDDQSGQDQGVGGERLDRFFVPGAESAGDRRGGADADSQRHAEDQADDRERKAHGGQLEHAEPPHEVRIGQVDRDDEDDAEHHRQGQAAESPAHIAFGQRCAFIIGHERVRAASIARRGDQRYAPSMAVSEHVIEVSDFDSEVVARSSQVPVLVDFWAPWCGPCRMLGPVLEKLAGESSGQFVLAKVNVDNHQDVAARYQIRGIPDVKLFVAGEVKAGFVGAQRENQVREFLKANIPSESDKLLDAAQKLIAAGDTDDARAAFEQVLASDPSSSAAHLALARLALGRGELAVAAEHVERISPSDNEHEQAKYIGQAIALIGEAREAGDEDALRARIEGDPDDVEAHYALAGHRLAAGDFRGALDSYLAVAQRQRKWREEAARKSMLTVFGLIGVRHPLSDEYRRELMLIY